MKQAIVFGAVVAVNCCLATTLAPFFGQQATVDRIFAAAVSSAAPEADMAALERIAEGRPENVGPQVAVSVGMPTDEAGRAEFRNPTVRAHALQRIGETGLPEAIDYLERLGAAGFAAEQENGQVQPAAQIALQQAKLLNVPGRQRKIEFLEKLLQEWGGSVASWGADQLCDMGSLPSLGLIAKSMRQRNPDQYGEGEIQFCEARIRVVASDPDRTQALAGVLSISRNTDDRRLIEWAVSGLVSMHTPEAYSVLDRYAGSIAALPEKSPERENLFYISEGIRIQRAQRPYDPKPR